MTKTRRQDYPILPYVSGLITSILCMGFGMIQLVDISFIE